jgi:phage major head subunit gpT-like protein
MGAASLGSRAIIGEFYSRLEQDLGNSWVPLVSNRFDSDQASEVYKWLGQSPQMREWIGERLAKGLRENGFTIINKTFEATLEVLVDEIRRDKTGQVMVRVQELAERANGHDAKLLSTLIENGAAALCYDGQFFFDTDHLEGDSGTQSNSIQSDITTTTAPTAGEMQTAILLATQQLMGLKDDQGEPFNENARRFLVMVPITFMGAAAAALGATVVVENATAVASNRLMALGSLGGFSYQLAINPRLTWTTKLAVFRADSPTLGLIRQEEEPISVSALAEGSEEEFKNNRHLYGVKAIKNAGYGMWQRACLVTFT